MLGHKLSVFRDEGSLSADYYMKTARSLPSLLKLADTFKRLHALIPSIKSTLETYRGPAHCDLSDGGAEVQQLWFTLCVSVPLQRVPLQLTAQTHCEDTVTTVCVGESVCVCVVCVYKCVHEKSNLANKPCMASFTITLHLGEPETYISAVTPFVCILKAINTNTTTTKARA